LDGNDTVIAGTSPASSIGKDFSYSYALNPHNQAKRLVTGAQKPPLSITYNNFKTVDSFKYAHNAIVECNSGVYLSAIKPVLESVTAGWTTDLGNWAVTCSNASNRQDNINVHLLCTQLTLLITSKNQNEPSSHQVTLHFYHTKDKIQVQGSTIISQGLSSATWLVKYLIEPLAANYIAANQQSISQINDALLSSHHPAASSCQSCCSKIDPRATQVRDHPLCCGRCRRMFHKRCTDRRDRRGGNWNRETWYCPECIAGNETARSIPGNQSQRNHEALLSLRPAQSLERPFIPPVHLLVPQRPSALQEDRSIIGINEVAFQPSEDDDPTAPENPNHAPPVSLVPLTSSGTEPRFPNNSIRQRSSNVPVTDPEREFEKTALDTCRGTIIQQEAELKRLNEGLDIRNKRIMQLDSQVGIASTFISILSH
jgi:hypothetical protein